MKAFPDATLVDVRAQAEAERAAPPLELLAAHPALMKRPLMAVDNTLFLSWSSSVEAEIKALL